MHLLARPIAILERNLAAARQEKPVNRHAPKTAGDRVPRQAKAVTCDQR
jgi:hypothetical protein